MSKKQDAKGQLEGRGGLYPRVERRGIETLEPNLNPRRITQAGKEKLKKSLAELGNLQPITFNVRTGKVLGGHQRIEVLREGGETETDVWVVDLPASKERAAMLALNTHAGDWDEEKLSDFLKGLEGEMDAEFFGLADMLDAEPVKIKPVTIQPPPKWAWVLVGVPIIEFASVQCMLDRLPGSALIKTTQNDGPKDEENGQS